MPDDIDGAEAQRGLHEREFRCADRNSPRRHRKRKDDDKKRQELTMGKWVPLGGSKNPVGWCCLHRFTLSVNQMKRKRCLIKDCRHFRKKKEHNYWKAKERANQSRKERKNDAT